ncbi:MAG: LD-carboxypeptidase [Calditrichaeota bacterium]|nr:MAG: LD-carboxypeptidase [Calditrichota bacterium]
MFLANKGNSVIKPERLQPGVTIGVVGPASPMIKSRLKKGLHYLEERGYRVKLGKHVFDEDGYFAGKDRDRAEDLNQMFRDPDIAAIFCTRGGYGSPRILPLIDYELIKKHPKILVGYSDITALQLAIFTKTRLITFSGPMVAVEMAKGMEPLTEYYFWQLLKDPERKIVITTKHGIKFLKPGKVRGHLLGGCLSMVCSLLGTPYVPDFDNAILFLEDIGEEPYKIDRYLTQLKLAGILHRIGGLILGKFEDCKPSSRTAPSLTLERIIEDITADLPIPVVTDFPYGHVDIKFTMPVGGKVLIDSEENKVEFEEAAVV